MRERPLLPIVGQPGPERADAARNRQKIIEVAARMIAEQGAEQLSLDEVARAAGVGVGTVYRRFGDRAGLVYALIDESERRFQAAFLTGPPPLGPGGPDPGLGEPRVGPRDSGVEPGGSGAEPGDSGAEAGDSGEAEAEARERIVAFLCALVDRVMAQREMFVLLEGSAKARYTGPYRVYHTHLAGLLARARPHGDVVYLADALLAPVNACLLGFQRVDRGMPAEAIKAGLAELVTAVCAAQPQDREPQDRWPREG
ncbi:helix-turn-helix domain-containing protein [Nonomuraea antri]|uniref:helix-turn-helix domain-containing protein n=1 Tax=Nonomuraea antri TaxID=2730852 RepID=UPI002E287A97|nr:helix-turn-helix domain-containing protein [Nonomuraea antri]